MICPSPATLFVYDPPWGKVLLVAHLLVAVFALGAVTHHWWLLLFRQPPLPKLARYARWMAISYPLAWLGGVAIYPAYNVLVRKAPVVGLEAVARWAVGLFEIKEHLGTFALMMLPWLVLSAYRYERLGRWERISYRAAAWVFTLFVYYTFVAGAVVTAVKGLS
jgi:hypothetical protein